MHLQTKIASIPQDKVVEEFSALLHHTKPFVSCMGGRFVIVPSYRGSVKIDTIAEKYLDAISTIRENKADLQKRLKSYDLWKRIENLYEKTNKAGSSRLRTLREIPSSSINHPRAILLGSHFYQEKNRILQFTPEDYFHLFPGKRIIKRVHSYNIYTGEEKEYFTAAIEFLLEASCSKARL